jgi:DNA-binding protein HU-beta
MNKSELITTIAAKAELSKRTAREAVSSLLKNITAALKKHEGVRLIGFGTFSVTTRAARQGRNPLTGESLNVPAKKVVRFKAGSELKLALRK